MGKVFVLILLVPALELYLLLQVGKQIGVLPTLALLFATAMLGVSLARAEGLRVLREFQEAMAAGRVPQEGVASGLLVLLGGALLVIPGVLTDMVGALLLVPFTRKLFVRVLLSRMQGAMERGTLHVTQTHVGVPRAAFSFGQDPRQHPRQRADSEIIDVEAEVMTSSESTQALIDGSDDDGRAT